MPLWIIYHPPGTFTTPESKQSLTRDITKIYQRTDGVNLPAFYVVVNFIQVDPSNTFIGGENSSRPFIRFVIDQIAARIANNDEAYERATGRIDKAINPHVEGRGWDWEYHVSETERRLWEINGIKPPALGSEGERRWREENRAFVLD